MQGHITPGNFTSTRFMVKCLVMSLMLLSSSAYSFALWSEAFPPLVQSDIETINRDCADIELQEPGTTWNWENPENGHSGTVTLIRVFQSQGSNCRVLRHHVRAGTDEPWVMDMTTCQDDEGRWVLRPEIKPAELQ
jgi:hypothetical protein